MDGVELNTVRQESEEFACNMHRWSHMFHTTTIMVMENSLQIHSTPLPSRWKFNFKLISRFILVHSCSIASNFKRCSIEMFHATSGFCFNHLNCPKIASLHRQHSIAYRARLCRRDINFILWSPAATCRLKRSKNKNSKNVLCKLHEIAETQSITWPRAPSADENISNGFSTVFIAPKSKLRQYSLELITFVSDFRRRWLKYFGTT